MKTALYNNIVKTALIVNEGPVALLKKLERGDADSSGSTTRTAGVVALVLVIFAAIAAAVASLASSTAGDINAPTW